MTFIDEDSEWVACPFCADDPTVAEDYGPETMQVIGGLGGGWSKCEACGSSLDNGFNWNTMEAQS